MKLLDNDFSGGSRQVTCTFKAPFGQSNREDDHSTVWSVFAPEHGASAVTEFVKGEGQ